MTTTTNAAPDSARTTVVTSDGLGRPIASAVTTGATSPTTTNTTYNLVGNVASQSNPYESTADSTYGITTFAYDALGRMTSQADSDGFSQRSWSYAFDSTSSSNRTTLTDELQNQSIRYTDALGRLKRVFEPNGSSTSASMETDYTYDSLNNLLTVTQKGSPAWTAGSVSRSYTYDGISRLIQSFNPESGWTCYGTSTFQGSGRWSAPNGSNCTEKYDGNGNLLATTPNLMNGAAYSVATFYCYDSSNRLTLKYTSGISGPCSNPQATTMSAYAYDGNLLSGSQAQGTSFHNAKGRLTDEQQLYGTQILSERVPYNYDTMGRIKSEMQNPYTPGSTSSYLYAYNYTYNEAGDVSSTYNNIPSTLNSSMPLITISHAYDPAGRLQTVNSSLTSSGTTTYPSPLYQVNNYGPVGVSGAMSLTYGVSNGTGILNRFRYYDTRQRLSYDELYPLTDTFGNATIVVYGTENQCISGSGNSCVAETGTVTVTAGGVTATANFNGTSTTGTIVEALAAAFNQNQNSPVRAWAEGSGTGGSGAACNGWQVTAPTSAAGQPCAVLGLTAVQFGQYGNVALTATATSSSTSTFVAASGVALAGGTGTPQGTQSYVTALTYDRGSRVIEATDPYNGSWYYGYDTLNRLTTGTFSNYQGTGVTTPQGVFTSQCWGYDDMGNRTFELEQGVLGQTPPTCPTLTTGNSTHWASYNSSNRVTNSDTGGLGYDASGNVTQDTFNTYVYDPDGRVCAVKNNVAGVIQYTQYVYDAEGKRVAKGSIPTLPASGSTCSAPVSANGFTLTNQYLRSANGDQDTEVLGSGTTASWHTNVYAEGKALATYSSGSGSNPPTLAFNFTDWLGTKRLQTTSTGQISMTWASDPFGNYLKSTGTATDDTEEHFTGQQRDRETAGMANSSGPLNSGNDYFGARYYASGMGRFLSPDPSQLSFADPTNPQSFNLYSYVTNNPLTRIDPTGMDSCDDGDDEEQYQDCEAVYGTDSGYYRDQNWNLFYWKGSHLYSYSQQSVSVSGNDPDSCDLSDPICQMEYQSLTQQIPTAPNAGTITAGTRAGCASSIADHEYSIAAHTTGGLSENYFVQAALGNGVSGLYDLWNSPSIGEGLSNLVKGGYNPGVPLRSFSNPIEGGVGGMITNGLIKAGISNVPKAAVDEVAGPIGLAKLAYDLGSFAYAYAFDCR